MSGVSMAPDPAGGFRSPRLSCNRVREDPATEQGAHGLRKRIALGRAEGLGTIIDMEGCVDGVFLFNDRDGQLVTVIAAGASSVFDRGTAQFGHLTQAAHVQFTADFIGAHYGGRAIDDGENAVHFPLPWFAVDSLPAVVNHFEVIVNHGQEETSS
jgi:hypothetical protein